MSENSNQYDDKKSSDLGKVTELAAIKSYVDHSRAENDDKIEDMNDTHITMSDKNNSTQSETGILLENSEYQDKNNAASSTSILNSNDYINMVKATKSPKQQSSLAISRIPLKYIPIFTIILPSLIMLAVFAFFVPHTSYNIMKSRAGLDLDIVMEVIRWCLFLTLAYLAKILAPDLVSSILHTIAKFYYIVRSSYIKQLPQLSFRWLFEIQKWISNAVYALTLLMLGSFLIVDNSASAVKKSLTDIIRSTSAIPTVHGDNIIYQEVPTWYFYFQRSLMVYLLYTIIIVIEKTIIRGISSNFFHVAFSERINNLHKNISIFTIAKDLANVEKVYRRPKESIQERSIGYSIADKPLVKDEFLGAAHFVFNELLKDTGRTELTKEDLEAIFYEKDVYSILAILDSDNSMAISKKEWVNAALETVKEEEAIRSGMVSQGVIIDRLDSIFVTISTIMTIVLGLSFYNLSITSYITSVGTFLIGLTIIFGSFASSIFESFIFLFITHVYDIGDTLILDGQEVKVIDIDILTTTVARWDGLAILIPTKTMITKTIYNVRRSGPQSEEITIMLEKSVSMQSIDNFCKILRDSLPGKEFTGKLDVISLIMSTTGVTLTLAVEHRTNFNNRPTMLSRRSLVKKKVASSLGECQIPYTKF